MENQKTQATAAPVSLNQTLSDRSRDLKTNPFTTYRDPETGLWIVVKAAG